MVRVEGEAKKEGQTGSAAGRHDTTNSIAFKTQPILIYLNHIKQYVVETNTPSQSSCQYKEDLSTFLSNKEFRKQYNNMLGVNKKYQRLCANNWFLYYIQ